MDSIEQADTDENQALIALNYTDIEQKIPLFDLSNMISSNEHSFSESGSITPSTIKGSLYTDDILANIISEVADNQKKFLLKEISDINLVQQEILTQLEQLKKGVIEQSKKLIVSAERYQIDVGISQLDLSSITKIQTDIDKIVSEHNKNAEQLSILNSIVQSINKFSAANNTGIILIKLYQENKGMDDFKESTEVKRFTLVAEKLSHLVNQPLTNNILHPIEIILFKEAINTLFAQEGVSSGVVCDIFVRKNNKIPVTQDPDIVEIHSVVLWKEYNDGDSKLYLIDPSNPDFSSDLIDQIISLNNINITQGVESKLYQAAQKQSIGREKAQARDCIDISVKIILELTYQTKVFPNKLINMKFKDTFSQISSDPAYAEHLLNNSIKQIREFTSTSDDLRHLVLQVARNSNPKCLSKKS